MSQNRSHAVMAQRVEAHDSLDHFPTPPWATRALCDRLEADVGCLDKLNCWEPACAEGHMSKALGEYFNSVYSSDVRTYGYGTVRDFLFTVTEPDFDWIITNPPFRLGRQFIDKALSQARQGVAMLVRTAFLESSERFLNLFSIEPPSTIYQFVERVPMFKGRLDRNGSTATAYCWIVWVKPNKLDPRFRWIAPCRKRLERDSDYPEIKDR
jgi:hypothetical protein